MPIKDKDMATLLVNRDRSSWIKGVATSPVTAGEDAPERAGSRIENRDAAKGTCMPRVISLSLAHHKHARAWHVYGDAAGPNGS